MVGEDYFEVMTSEMASFPKVKVNFFNVQYPLFPTQVSLWGGIRWDRSRSVAPGSNFSSGWDLFFSI